MEYLLRVLLVLTLVVIFFQDIKERRVWFFLFLVFPICGASLFCLGANNDFFFWNSILINSCIVLFMLVGIYTYLYICKKGTIKEALGLGDILFFFGIGVSFPPISFINFFVFAILFTFVFYIILRKFTNNQLETVPLAGSMALFFLCVYTIYWLGFYDSIYNL